jgi:hypothetical protein
MQDMIELLLVAPESQISDDAKDLIRKWSNPPTYEEVYDTVSQCCHASLVSDFAMSVLMIIEDKVKNNASVSTLATNQE